jgi:hypothetical protein
MLSRGVDLQETMQASMSGIRRIVVALAAAVQAKMEEDELSLRFCMVNLSLSAL